MIFFSFLIFFFFNTLVSNNKEGDRKAKGKQKILAVDCQDRGGRKMTANGCEGSFGVMKYSKIK